MAITEAAAIHQHACGESKTWLLQKAAAIPSALLVVVPHNKIKDLLLLAQV